MNIFKNMAKQQHGGDVQCIVKEEGIYAPCAGVIHELSESSDEVFRDKLMGEGFYVTPAQTASLIASPMSGEIVSIFETKHAFTIVSDCGVQLLIHIGLDTVALQGIPFRVLVKEHTHVKRGDAIVEVDFAYIQHKGLSTDVYVCILNSKEIELHDGDQDGMVLRCRK